ncbi:MAG: bacillithiol system redox-active protein YtxJ [Crocinitomicaceae bacterium]|nr:bacillithiol system redox-active protein YtxJ [Crocinitomicaceae bacterium]
MWGSSKNKTIVNWNHLTEMSQLADLENISGEKPVLIFKHSTRCSISSMAKNRLELYWDQTIGIEPWYLDLLNYRNISDEIANRYGVVHQSPQILLIKNGACTYHASHNEIDFNHIKKLI